MRNMDGEKGMGNLANMGNIRVLLMFPFLYLRQRLVNTRAGSLLIPSYRFSAVRLGWQSSRCDFGRHNSDAHSLCNCLKTRDLLSARLSTRLGRRI